MGRSSSSLLIAAVNIFCVFVVVSHAQQSPERFANFLLGNKWNGSNLPLSYRFPDGYWTDIRPMRYYNKPMHIAAPCDRNVNETELDNYMLQTEMMLSMFGLNLYDGAVREIALALVGHADVAQKYERETLYAGKTRQLGNIRASNPCKGIMHFNSCSDPHQVGNCGFCYGGNDGANGVSLDSKHAYFFRMITDIFAYEGTVDQRCPEKKIAWSWNDWRPVTGENAWANFLGPLHVAYIQAKGDADSIPDDSPAMQLALAMFQAFQVMQIPKIGGIAYAPYNTYDSNNDALGATVSVENCASSLASLRAFLHILENKKDTQHKNLIPQVQTMMDGLTNFLKSAYDPSVGYFVQGGWVENGAWNWNKDENSSFAIDCQTWVLSVLGAPTVDSWFGKGTALKIWETSKRLGGYQYDAATDTAQGVGFSVNKDVQVLSGEWTFGAINMLRILAKQYTEADTSEKLMKEAQIMRQSIEDRLTAHDNSLNSDVINYSNKRYYIPWGWFANPVSATASVAWAVMVDSNFNPFVLGGAYA